MFRICRTEELAENKGFEFIFPVGENGREAFVISQHGQFFAYFNSCPHTGVSLNWQPGQFMDVTGSLIQCSVHGALFQPEDGKCIHGPCLGLGLEKIELTTEDDWLVTHSPE